MRDLPEYVPITSTPTEMITEDTIMRVTNRVYIFNLTLTCRNKSCRSSNTGNILMACRCVHWL